MEDQQELGLIDSARIGSFPLHYPFPGRLLNQLRSHAGLTQLQLARMLDVSNVTVSRWENDVVPVPYIVIMFLAEYNHYDLVLKFVPRKTGSDAGFEKLVN